MFKSLIGKRVDGAFINADSTAIILCCGGEFIELCTDAECCSETWIEHVTGFDRELIGATIKSVESIMLGEGVPTRQESDTLYGVKIKHDGKWSGDSFIEFRNSSNGYYGGWMEDRVLRGMKEGFTKLEEDF